MVSQQDIYETSDYSEAAFYLAGGCKLAGTKSDDGTSRIIFLISPIPTSEIQAGWRNGSAMINAQRFAHAIKAVKHAIYAGGAR